MLTSKHFKPEEYCCRCGCGLGVQQELLDLLDSIRDAYGKPIELTCAARCAKHNAAVGGAPHSQHVQGRAADLVWTPELAAFVEANRETLDFWQEDPAVTTTWLHVQTVPPASGARVFKP